MNDVSPKPLGQGLVYEDSLPLAWAPAGVADDASFDHIQEANEKFLRIASVLDEQLAEPADAEPELTHELRRLESKLDMLLEMVGRALAAQLTLPPAAHVWLSSERIEWISPDKPPGPQAQVLVSLYLVAAYPYPLLLAGKVHAVEADAAGQRVTVVFEELGETVRDWLDKTIFRHHRRQIAHARRNHPHP